MANSRDELISELLRMARTEKVTFEKGLSETSSDSMAGFMGGVSNMDNDKGVAIRRMGTRCLNNPDASIDLSLIHSTIISGCPVCLFVTKTRQVYAALNEYPERLLRVFKRGFAPLRNEQRTSTDKWVMGFRRGAKFYALEDDSRLRIINEYGDTLTINKRGYIQVFKSLPLLTTVDLPTQLSDARTDTETSLYLGLEIEDTTHHLISKFNIVDDPMKQFIPMKGQVAVAMVNNEGVIGPLSDPAMILTDYKHAYISLVEARSLRGKFDCVGIAWTNEADFDGAYVERVATIADDSSSDGPHDMVESGFAINNVAPSQGGIAGSVESVTVMIAQAADGRCFMWFDYQSLGSTAANAPELEENGVTATHPIIIDGPIEYLKVHSDLGPTDATFNFADSMMPLTINPQTFMFINGVQYNADVILNYQWTSTTRILEDAGGGGDIYSGQLFLVDLNLNMLKGNLLDSPTSFRVRSSSSAMYGTTGVIKNLLRTKIKMWKTAAGKLYFLRTKVKYNLPNGNGYACRNKGFDCWEYTYLNNPLDSATITDIDRYNLELTVLSPYDLFCPVPDPDQKNEFWDKLLYGRRFAVWNDGRIIAKSQMAYIDDATQNIIYDVSE